MCTQVRVDVLLLDFSANVCPVICGLFTSLTPRAGNITAASLFTYYTSSMHAWMNGGMKRWMDGYVDI